MVDKTTKNRENGGKSRHLDNSESADDKRKNGISNLIINSAPNKNGSNMVVKRYTDSIEKELMLAIFPVPKNAMLIKMRKNAAMRISLGFNFLDVPVDLLTSSLYVFPLYVLDSKKYSCCSINSQTKTTIE